MNSVSSSKYVAMLFYVEFVEVKSNSPHFPVKSAALLADSVAENGIEYIITPQITFNG